MTVIVPLATQAAAILAGVGLSATPVLGMTMGMPTGIDGVQPRTILDSTPHRWLAQQALAGLVQGNGRPVSVGDWEVSGQDNHDESSVVAVRSSAGTHFSRSTQLNLRWHPFFEGYRLRQTRFAEGQGLAEVLHSVGLRGKISSRNTVNVKWDETFAAIHHPVLFMNDQTSTVGPFPRELLPYLGLIRFLGLLSSMTREILKELGERFPETQVFLKVFGTGFDFEEIEFPFIKGLGHRFEITIPEAKQQFRKFYVYFCP